MKKKINYESNSDVLFDQKVSKRRKTKKRKVVEQVSHDNLVEGLEQDCDLGFYRDIYDSMRDW